MIENVLRRGGMLVLACLLLVGCTSIPLSTLWKMRSFDAADLAAVQPGDVRLAGLVEPAPMRIDPARSKLELQLTPRTDGLPVEKYRFGLRETQVYDPRLNPSRNSRWQVFALDDAGLATWVQLKPELLDIKQRYQAAKFEFSFDTDGNKPTHLDAMIVSAKLQLGIDQAPLALLDHARLPIHDTTGSHRSSP